MTEYCAGFMFDKTKVALVLKKRPEWMRGKLNGIGGHIEPGELPQNAMVREFEEETGVKTTVMQWWPFAVLSGEDFKVHFFSTLGDLTEVKSTTDEDILVVETDAITVYNSIPNLTWLVPMSRSIMHERAEMFLIQESY